MTFEHQAPFWLPGGHLQTIYPVVLGRLQKGYPSAHHQPVRRVRVNTPDGDFIDFDWFEPVNSRSPSATVVLFHGLEGSSQSVYARAFAEEAGSRGLRLVVPHFRGCSGELNRLPRAYHSGDIDEIDWMMRVVAAQSHGQPLYALGVSLGGNALMAWAGRRLPETHDQWTQLVSLAAVSSPLNLAAAGRAIDTGINRILYADYFLKTMREKAQTKWQQFPGLFDLQTILRAKTLRVFDDLFTARLHGFENVDDYYERASALPWLASISKPALILNARNDPFIPWQSVHLKSLSQPCPKVTQWLPAQGGHVGFVSSLAGPPFGMPGSLQPMTHKVLNWLTGQAPAA
jgi:uncharacterized protein